MSLQANTELMELAQYHLDYWAGEGIGKVIEADIERGDLEQLEADIKQSASLMFQLEYNPQ